MEIVTTQPINRWQLIQELEQALEGRVDVETQADRIEVINIGSWDWSSEKVTLIRSVVNNHIAETPRDPLAEIDKLRAEIDKLKVK